MSVEVTSAGAVAICTALALAGAADEGDWVAVVSAWPFESDRLLVLAVRLAVVASPSVSAATFAASSAAVGVAALVVP